MPPSSSSPVATCYRIHHTMSWPALSPPRNATLCYLTPRYATLRYATPRHATLRHVTLRYATLRCFSSPISSSQLFLRCLPLSLSLVTCLVACVLVACLLFLSHPLFPFVPVGVSLLPPLASSRLVASRRVSSRHLLHANEALSLSLSSCLFLIRVSTCACQSLSIASTSLVLTTGPPPRGPLLLSSSPLPSLSHSRCPIKHSPIAHVTASGTLTRHRASLKPLASAAIDVGAFGR